MFDMIHICRRLWFKLSDLSVYEYKNILATPLRNINYH